MLVNATMQRGEFCEGSELVIKAISADQVIVGMFVHDLKCSWMDHPFLTNQFEIKSEAVRRQILDTGIQEIWIDTSRGIDIPTAGTDDKGPEAQASDAPVAKAASGTAAPAAQDEAPMANIVLPPMARAEEVKRAQKLHRDTCKLVSGMMSDVRMGKQIQLEQCEPMVDRILESIFRFPSALLPLAQVKSRDEYTFQHSASVSALAVAFGRTLDLPRDSIKELALGGLLHDVGKALVPSAILNKPGKLTDSEYMVMKHHAAYGADLLKKTQGISDIAFSAVAQHHERFDGTGYPQGLKGDAITLYGQMMAIIDVYDAITSLRVYHKGMPPTEALRKMYEWSATHFNPRLVQAFIKGVGIYPAGSLVRLESGKMGVVHQVSTDRLLQPVVKIFYHTGKQCYIDPVTVDLSIGQDKIVAHESFDTWGIDQARWL